MLSLPSTAILDIVAGHWDDATAPSSDPGTCFQYQITRYGVASAWFNGTRSADGSWHLALPSHGTAQVVVRAVNSEGNASLPSSSYEVNGS